MHEWRAALGACRLALARLELTSAGQTPNVGGTGGGHPGSAPPPPASSSWWTLRERLRVATTIEELERIEAAATAEWQHATGRGTARLDRGDGVTLDQLVREAIGHDPQAVAWRWSIDIARVRRIRARAELDPETGRPAEAVAAEARGQDLELRRAKVARMDAAGMSLKQIALACGCSTATVRADLGRRAA